MKKSVLAISLASVAAIAFFTLNKSEETVSQSSAGAPLAQVTPPATLSANAEIGEQFYNKVCASCHGINAAGQDGIAPPLIHDYYKPSHHGDEAFQSAAANGVQAHHWPFGNMPPVEGVSRGDIKLILEYVREVQAANGIN